MTVPIGDRMQRCDGPRDRQRQHAVPAGFDAGRTHRARPGNPLRGPSHPGGRTRRLRQAGALRGRGAGRHAAGHAAREPDPGASRPHSTTSPRPRWSRRWTTSTPTCASPCATGPPCAAASPRSCTPTGPTRRRCRRTRSTRRSPSSTGWPPTISPCSACGSTAFPDGDVVGRSRRGHGPRHPVRSHGEGAAARARARGDDARDPRLPAGAGAAHRHQGEREVARPPARPSRLCRREAVLAGRVGWPASCASSGCSPRAPIRSTTSAIPYHPAQGGAGGAARRLRPRQPFRPRAAQRAGELSARRAVPGRRRHAARPSRPDMLSLYERPRVRALARTDRFDRFVSVLVYIPKDRYDTTVRQRVGEVLAQALRGPLLRRLPGLSRRAAGAHALHHRPRRRGDAAASTARRAGGGGQRRRAHLARRAARRAGRDDRCPARARDAGRRAMPARSPPPIARRSRPPRPSPTSPCSSGSTTITRAPCASSRRDGDEASRVALMVFSRGPADAAVGAGAAAGEPRLPGRQRADLPRRVPAPGDADDLRCTTWRWSAPRAAPSTLDKPEAQDRGRADGACSQGRTESDGFNALVLEAGLGWRDVAIAAHALALPAAGARARSARTTCGRRW